MLTLMTYYSTEGDETVPEGEAGAEVFNCPEDFLTIASVRLCGQKFNDATSEADFTKNAPVYGNVHFQNKNTSS